MTTNLTKDISRSKETISDLMYELSAIEVGFRAIGMTETADKMEALVDALESEFDDIEKAVHSYINQQHIDSMKSMAGTIRVIISKN